MMLRALAVLAALGLATPASAFDAGSTCTLKTTVKAAKKTKRWSRSARKINAGTQVKIVGPRKGYVAAKVNGKTRYFKAKALRAHCALPESNAEVPDDAVYADAPLQPLPTGTAASPPSNDAFGGTVKIKVAVLDLQTDILAPEERDALTQTITETLDGLGVFKSISSRDIASMLEVEAAKQMLGCDAGSCIAEIGAALGADLIISGSVVKLSETWKVQLQLMNILRANVEQRASREYTGAQDGLFDEVRAATQILVRDILGERSGTVALNVNEIGATVKVDGAIVGVTPLSNLELAGGVHSVEVQKTGFIVFRQDVKVQSAREAAINVALIPSPEFIEEYESEAGFTRTLAWTTLGVGVAALGGAGAAYMLGSGEADDLNADIAAYNQQALRSTVQEQDLQDREGSVARWDTVAVVSAGIGVAALATGVVLFLTGDDPDRYDNLKGSINATASRKENNDEGWFATVSPTGGSFGLRF